MSLKSIGTAVASISVLLLSASALAMGKHEPKKDLDLGRFRGASGSLELIIDDVLVSVDHYKCSLHHDVESNREVLTFVNDYGVAESAKRFSLADEDLRTIHSEASVKFINRNPADIDHASPCGTTIFYLNVKPRFIQNKLTVTESTVEFRTRYWCGFLADSSLQGKHVDRAVCRFEKRQNESQGEGRKP